MPQLWLSLRILFLNINIGPSQNPFINISNVGDPLWELRVNGFVSMYYWNGYVLSVCVVLLVVIYWILKRWRIM